MTQFLIQEQTLEREVYTVSQLNLEVRLLLDSSFPTIWVEGEISNLRKPGSGHIYFGLKDNQAQVRCAMFRLRHNQLNFQPKDGMQVLVRARVSLYEERGDYQLIVDHMEEAGDGALRRAFDALKKRLLEEGLFDSKRKKPVPSLPKCIGVVTSSTGAAIRDILSVLCRRFATIPIIIYPSQVQGSEAANQIVAALKLANQRQECDVLILARGGGSLEDLWPFNEEKVARAIYASNIPIVTGIGHEIDFTIADFVADQRAPTPSAAAELVSPDNAEWFKAIAHLGARLKHLIHIQCQHAALLLTNLRKRLQHPGRRLQDQAQRLDDIELRLRLAQAHALKHQRTNLQHLSAKLQHQIPSFRINQLTLQCSNLQHRLDANMQHQFKQWQQKLEGLLRALATVSPLNTLQRGYAIVSSNDKIISNINQTKANDNVQVQLVDGTLHCYIEDIVKKN